MKVYFDGDFVSRENAKISVFDHGFLYGDGCFEGIRIYDGCVYKLDEHIRRLEYSAKALMIEPPLDHDGLCEAVLETCRENGLRDGYIRMLLTRGEGHLGLSPHGLKAPSLIIIADKIQLYPENYYTEGLKIITAATRRVNPAALPPMVKSLNYLNNILAKIEAINCGCLEAIMLNDQGFVAECTGDNVFTYFEGALHTPPLAAGALRGITRDAVIELARAEGFEVVERDLTRYDLWISEEFFLTGTAAELIPVVEVDGRRVGDGKPGPVTGRLLKAFHELVKRDGRSL